MYHKPLIVVHARNGRLKKVKDCLERGAYINDQTKYGDTALIKAVKNEDMNMAEFLVSEGANINIQRYSGNSALMCACASCHGGLDMIKFLVSKGAKINVQNDDGNTALILASRYGRLDAIMYLVSKGANISLRNKYGKSSIFLASVHGEKETAEFLTTLKGPHSLQHIVLNLIEREGLRWYYATRNFVRQIEKRKGNK